MAHLATALVTSITMLLLLDDASPAKSILRYRPSTPMSTYRRLQKTITEFNCADKPKSRLRLPADTVAQKPEFNTLQLSITFPNRTGLLHIHNMAMNRAFFYSYILQTFNVSNTDFPNLPGLLYTYLSAVSDVTANPKTINGSTLMYDILSAYPNWFVTLPFNTTLNLFAVRAIRVDNTFQTPNFLREPTLNTIRVYDLGVQNGLNYTWGSYRNGPWYGRGPNDPRYLPDSEKQRTVGAEKHRFIFDMFWGPKEKVGKSFFGPPYAGQLEGQYLPVRFTQPWFDCGLNDKAFNEWVVSAVSPVVDFMPRYSKFIHLQRPRYVAVAAMDTYFINIPINLCPISKGNSEPNLLANSGLCKPSTVCESRLPPRAVQFLASSFKCRCAAGFRYPILRNVPWTGSIYRKATQDEYKVGFKCEKIHNVMTWPTSEGINERGTGAPGALKLTKKRRKRHADHFPSQTTDTMRPAEFKSIKHRAIVDEKSDRKENQVSNIPTASEDLDSQLKKRMDYVQKVLQNHFNVSDLQEILQEKVDYDSLKQDTRRLVSSFSQSPSLPRQRVKHRFNADWIHAQTPSPQRTAGARQKLISRVKRMAKPAMEVRFNKDQFSRMHKVLNQVGKITAATCHRYGAQDLLLPGPVGYGAEKQFHNQASTALRLAHFLSAFLQLNNNEEIASIRVGQRLHEQHIIGEALGNVAGDVDMVSSGVFFERNAFVDSNGQRRQYFGPLVYRKGSLAASSFEARDTARFDDGYHQNSWFQILKQRWATNSYGLQKFIVQAFLRGKSKDQFQTRYQQYPMTFRAPRLEDGHWSQPYFDCKGPVPDWLITYAVPFFGKTAIGIKFMGVVTATVTLRSLNINQCPGAYHQANFFKDTALCDPTSTYCHPIYGLGFTWGSYECHCRAGFEFPYSAPRYFFLGSQMETEYNKLKANKPNLFGILKCREASATALRTPLKLQVFLLVIWVLMARLQTDDSVSEI